MSLAERDLIESFFARADRREDVVLGIGDDAAVTRVRAGMELVSATDTIVDAVHFPSGLAAGDIGYRALAVNLSDLAAMGAEACWALLSLSCPRRDREWYADFAAGFFALAERSAVALIGGDLVRGPLAVTVTVLGQVPAGAALTRGGARPGDALWVTGSPGGAAAALATMLANGITGAPGERAFTAPVPRLAEGIGLRGIASAVIDISDGLFGDALHMATASGVAIDIDPPTLANVAAGGDVGRALRGGDDYELLFTVPPARAPALARTARTWDCPVTEIGHVREGAGVQVPGYDISQLAGYDHFAS